MQNPYNWAFKSVMDLIPDRLGRLGLNGPVELIFDEQSEMDAALRGWMGVRQSAPEAVKPLLAPMPLFQNDKEILPLQAADLYAWWIRKWEVERDEEKLRRPQFPWGGMNLTRLYIKVGESNFTERFANMISGAVFASDLKNAKK